MPRRAKAKGFYQRGAFWLDWDKRSDGALRSPNLAIFWHDAERGRLRSLSAGTANDSEPREALDRHYLTNTRGESICPTCGQRRPIAEAGYFVTHAIADYLVTKPGDNILKARLNHILDYIATLVSTAIICRQVNEDWIRHFRTWSAKLPVVFTSGRVRDEPRAASTT